MKNSGKRAERRGFTLIELVIVMGILAVVLGLSMSSLLQTQYAQVFNNNFGKLFSLVSNARSLAITGKGQLDFTDFDNDTFTNATTPIDYVTPANYGVNFNTTVGSVNVRLFADINPPASGAMGQKGAFNEGLDHAAGEDVVLDSLILPDKTTLIVKDGSGQTPDASSIFFNMKYADISFENLADSPAPFTWIQLTDENIGVCRQIKIHKLAGIPEVGPCE